MNLIVVGAVVAALIALRFLKPNALAWTAATWVALYVAFRWGIEPPLPASIVNMFMGIVTIALLAFVSADSERLRSAKSNIVNFLVRKKYTVPLLIVLVALPLLVAFKIYVDMSRSPQPPVTGRTIHPPPPATISFKGRTVDLGAVENPFRELEESDPEAFAAHVENGKRVYHQNCVFCHGDHMEGDGIFAHGFDPIPANFQDATTIAMLQESYLFWRIAKGAPGLPMESTPWASAMPAWEKFLTEDEIWDVIIFLYDYTGHRPRAKEELH
ncbi:MAG: cytochrome c [Rhodothermales bacterium]|nr:cytochrome c [Rhodothermales bacterium]